MKELWNAIINQIDQRQNLSKLRQEIKNEAKKQMLLVLVAENTDILTQLLQDDDAKTRKNAALLMGDLSLPCYCSPLFEGYLAEQQRFVKGAYLNALQNLDYSAYLPQLKTQLDILSNTERTPENMKHIAEEIRALNALIVAKEGITKHSFTGYHNQQDCILLTNRNYSSITAKQITENNLGTIVASKSGVHVITKELSSLLAIRTYSELLFLVPGLAKCSTDPGKAAATVVDSGLIPWLSANHNGCTPFFFRVEVKSPMPLDQKSRYAKRFASELEHLSSRQLINSTSDYECELRLIEDKKGFFHVLVKLYTLEDRRFSYRKEHIAASIRPVDAALFVALASEYMIEDAHVLDPFCGVGTMLIERQMIHKANTSYGIDRFGEAIEKARCNTIAADQIIHYINRDFFTFEHEHLFDEIFTNLPFRSISQGEDDIEDIYQQFFACARNYLTEAGTLILYSHNRDLIERYGKAYHYELIQEYTISEKKGTYLFVLRC